MQTILIVMLSCFLQISPKTITIDVSRNDKLNISQIAEVKAIPLNFLQSDNLGVRQVLVTPNYLYATVGELGVPLMDIYQLKRDGTLIRQVGLKSDDTKEFLKVNAIAYLENTDELAIAYDKVIGIGIFDGTGKLKRKVENTSFEDYDQLFNNKVWMIDSKFERKKERVVRSLISKDLATLRKDTLIKYYYPLRIVPGATTLGLGDFSFSVADNKLYFTISQETGFLSVNRNNQVEKSYRFEYKNLGELPIDTLANPFRRMFNKYIEFGYQCRLDVGTRDRLYKCYSFIYNKTTGKGYNIDLQLKKGKYTSGIKDDIFDTGYFQLQQTNSGDYAFSWKSGADVSGKVQGIKDESIPVIFLIKFK